MKLRDIPCVKDQAYFIMVGLEGSWLFDATYPSNQDEDWCRNFVDRFDSDHGMDVKYYIRGEEFTCRSNAGIQEHIDDSYEWIMNNRRVKQAK